jgi:hypothetical protein
LRDVIRVRWADGSTDAFWTEGGETAALAGELRADPAADVWTYYDGYGDPGEAAFAAGATANMRES